MAFFKRMLMTSEIENYSEVDQYNRHDVRMFWIREQGDLCYHCSSPLSYAPPQDILEKKITPHIYPANFFNGPSHIHHNHDTDKILGVVHPHCNAVLWEYFNE